MTRYARSAGSKSCNSKHAHLAASWLSLREQVGRVRNHAVREESSPLPISAGVPPPGLCDKELWFDFGVNAVEAIPRHTNRSINDFPESKNNGKEVKSEETSGCPAPVSVDVEKDAAVLKSLLGNEDSFIGKHIRGKGKRLTATSQRTHVVGRTFQVASKMCIQDLRRNEKALKREKKKVCFSCRKWGHQLAECPELAGSSASEMSPAGGLCYHCGSTEHKANQCNKKWINGHRFARCFVCGEDGHLARECPENPKGKYPKGGSCRNCGKTSHLCGECPMNVSVCTGREKTLMTISKGPVDCLPEDIGLHSQHKVSPQKIIQF